MDASQLPVGKSAESSRKVNFPGIYEMEREGLEPARVISVPGDEGVVQADGYVRLGYKRVGDVPTRLELDAMRKKQMVKDRVEEKRAKLAEDEELEALVAEELALDAKKKAAPTKEQQN